MPGNKNSGRKSKTEPDVDMPDIRALSTQSQSDKKCKVVDPLLSPRQTRQGTSLLPTPDSGVTSSTNVKLNMSKTSRVSSIEFKNIIGTPLDSFSNNCLPQKREILQRWRGLQIKTDFNTQFNTRDHAWKIWPEIQFLWAESQIPVKEGKHAVKMTGLLTLFTATKIFLEHQRKGCLKNIRTS